MALDEYDKLDYMAEMARAQRISPKVFEDRIFEELVWNLKVIADALQTIERRSIAIRFEVDEEEEADE